MSAEVSLGAWESLLLCYFFFDSVDSLARRSRIQRRARIRRHGRGATMLDLPLEKLADAAKIMDNPVTIQLRYLQTLTEIAAEKNSTIVFPLPIDLLRMLRDTVDGAR